MTDRPTRPLTDEELTALEVKAKVATPGPWWHLGTYGMYRVEAKLRRGVVAQFYDATFEFFVDDTPYPNAANNAAFISKADPTTVLQLLADLAAARAERDELKDALRYTANERDDAQVDLRFAKKEAADAVFAVISRDTVVARVEAERDQALTERDEARADRDRAVQRMLDSDRRFARVVRASCAESKDATRDLVREAVGQLFHVVQAPGDTKEMIWFEQGYTAAGKDVMDIFNIAWPETASSEQAEKGT